MRFSTGTTLLLALGAQAFASEIAERDVVADLAMTILKELMTLSSCSGCEGVIGILKGVAVLGDPIFADVITSICHISKVCSFPGLFILFLLANEYDTV